VNDNALQVGRPNRARDPQKTDRLLASSFLETGYDGIRPDQKNAQPFPESLALMEKNGCKDSDEQEA
jgi:hypothetical protein